MQRPQSLVRKLRRVAYQPGRWLGLATLLLSLSANAAVLEELLSDLRWQARVLLVFAADAEDVRAQAFFKFVETKACEVEQRDILVGQIFAAGESLVADKKLSPSNSAEVRDRFGIAATEFRVLLIGKDGGVKATYSQTADLEDVFSLIDGMPMRRREIRAQSAACTE